MRFNSRPLFLFIIEISCINFEARHNETFCPKCGSKIKKADFHSSQVDDNKVAAIVTYSCSTVVQPL
jgi:hypothetical protein